MQIPVCENRGVCTTDCPLRPSCTKLRVSGLIRAVITDERTGEVYQDSYVNDIGIRDRKSVV